MLRQTTDSKAAHINPALVRGYLLFLFVLVLPIGLAGTPRILADGDVSWHVATGQWIFRHGAIPVADPFSYTAAGHSWVAMEWFADVLLAAAFRIAGYGGLAALVTAALMLLHAIIWVHLQSRLRIGALCTLMLGMDLVLAPFIFARPHLLAWPLLAAWTVMLLRASGQERAPPLWGALLLTIWTNVHGSFVLAVPIGAAIAFDALRRAQWRTLPGWLGFAFVSLIAVSLNANGLAGLVQPFRTANLAMLPLIQEWQPSTLSFSPQFYVVLVVGTAAFVWPGLKVPVGQALLLLVMLAMALGEMRHQSWFIIVATILLPSAAPARESPGFSRWPLAAGAVALIAARAAWPMTPPESPSNPWKLIASLPPSLRSEPVFNGYSFGGPLILSGIKPYIDGRAEIYGDAFVTDYVDISRGNWKEFNRVAEQYHIGWTLLSPTDAKLIHELDSSPDWRRIYVDPAGVVHVRVRR